MENWLRQGRQGFFTYKRVRKFLREIHISYSAKHPDRPDVNRVLKHTASVVHDYAVDGAPYRPC
jgi:hypothetical protein